MFAVSLMLPGCGRLSGPADSPPGSGGGQAPTPSGSAKRYGHAASSQPVPSVAASDEFAGAAPAAAAPLDHSGPLAASERTPTPSPGAPPAEATDPGATATPDASGFHREAYAHIVENEFLDARANPLSTFAIDVDTASYANVRRMLRSGALPPAGAVRIEELINYFTYAYDPPMDDTPFAVNAEVASCPWRPEHRLLRIGLKGRIIERSQRPAGNLVFLVDVSGSMDSPDKLPLVKQALQALIGELNGDDRVALVVYAGEAGIVLPSTCGDEKHTIATAVERLGAGGSTHGSAGITTAYEVARQHYLPGGANRVILCTDGDFNVGVTSEDALVKLIEEEARSGVFLSVLGFGTGNYQDSRMEQLADRGNGNYGYIDTFAEARKLLVEQLSGTLVTIAKDVKIQIEFNPAQVAAYRQIGYENRRLAAEDFRDDLKDAGEIGAGHAVTALYEIVPVGVQSPSRAAPELRYQAPTALAERADSGELLTLMLRYKQPEGIEATELQFPIRDTAAAFEKSSPDFQFAASVAGFGMLLRGSSHAGLASWDAVLEWAQPASQQDATGYHREFLELVEQARRLQPQRISDAR